MFRWYRVGNFYNLEVLFKKEEYGSMNIEFVYEGLEVNIDLLWYKEIIVWY